MSEEELLEGFTSGTISRRAFVTRLVAGGLSLTAAAAFADAIVPATAAAATRARNAKKRPPRDPHDPHGVSHDDHDPHGTEDADADDLS